MVWTLFHCALAMMRLIPSIPSLCMRFCLVGRKAVSGVQQIADLPANARAYLNRIEDVCGIPIDMISTGPDRQDTIELRDLFPV